MKIKLTEQYDIAVTKREMWLLASALAQYRDTFDVPDETRDAIEEFIDGFGELPGNGKEKPQPEEEVAA